MKHLLRRSTLAIGFLVLVACGSESDDTNSNDERTPLLSAATLGEQTILTVPDYLAQEKFARANPKNGSRQAQICKACHSLEEGGPNMIGPALFGFFGRNVGGQSGFDYSAVMRNANFVWTPRALDAWLAQPGHFLPGNRMTFAGVMRQQDRDDLIAYLLEAASPGDTEQD